MRATGVTQAQVHALYKVQQKGKPRLGDKGMAFVAAVALIAIACNAVLIQTVWVDSPGIKNVVRVGVLTLLVAAMFLRRTIIPVWLVATILVSAALMLARSNPDQLSLIFVLVLVPALWSLPERVVDKIALGAAFLSLILIFLLLRAGITHNEFIDLRARHTYGVDSVPFFMNVVYGASALLTFYVHKYQHRFRHLITAVSVAGTYYFFKQTDGRGGFYTLVVFVALVYLMPRLVRLPLVSWVLMSLPALFLGVSLWIASRANDFDFNVLLSFRPRYYGEFLDQVSMTDLALSASVKQNTAVKYVDTSYLHLLVGCGFALFVMFCLLYMSAVGTMVRDRLYLELAFITAALIYSVSESILLRIENIFIIYAWWLILRRAELGPQPTAPPVGSSPNPPQDTRSKSWAR